MNYEELRKAAEAVLDGPSDGSCACEACWGPAAIFYDSVGPEAVLALLDEIARLQKLLSVRATVWHRESWG